MELKSSVTSLCVSKRQVSQAYLLHISNKLKFIQLLCAAQGRTHFIILEAAAERVHDFLKRIFHLTNILFPFTMKAEPDSSHNKTACKVAAEINRRKCTKTLNNVRNTIFS